MDNILCYGDCVISVQELLHTGKCLSSLIDKTMNHATECLLYCFMCFLQSGYYVSVAVSC